MQHPDNALTADQVCAVSPQPTLRRPGRRGAGTPFPFSAPSGGGEWSAGRRQGAALRRPCTPLAIGACTRLADGFARPIPRRARPAMAGLRGSPPGRCASRRSTASPRCRRPAPRQLSGSRRQRSVSQHGCADVQSVRADFGAGITFFWRVVARMERSKIRDANRTGPALRSASGLQRRDEPARSANRARFDLYGLFQ